jgi:hypothetical protein
VQLFRVTRAAGLGDDPVHFQCQKHINIAVMHVENAHASIDVSSKSGERVGLVKGHRSFIIVEVQENDVS